MSIAEKNIQPNCARLAPLFALNMLVLTEAGGIFARAGYDRWGRGSGFENGSELVDIPGPAAVRLYEK
jgi:hypothetical protein